MIELTGACLTLARVKQFSGIPVLVRSVLEAYVDLRCLSLDPKYLESIELKMATEYFELYKSIAESKEPDCIEMAKHNHGTIAQIKADIQYLESNRGAKRYGAKRRFELAKLEHVFPVIWNELSVATHNNPRELLERHVARTASTHIGIYAPTHPRAETHALMLSEWLCDAADIMRNRYAKSTLSNLEAMQTYASAYELLYGEPPPKRQPPSGSGAA